MKNFSPDQFSVEEKAGQLFFPAAFVNDSEEGIRQTEKLIVEQQIGGLTFFHSRASAATNYEGKKEVVYNEESFKRLKELISRYQGLAKIPLLMCIDAEWGLAMRIEDTPQYPYALTLGALQDNVLITEVGKCVGEDLRKTGIHLNLAPVGDINLNPDNPVISYRSFGEDKIKVTAKALAFYEGMQQAGVLGCLKHFPGHGDTAVDSHLGLPVIRKTKQDLYANELYPFFEAVKAEVDSIMVGHLAVPELSGGKEISATLSREIVTGLLREEMGYEGVIISDALNMRSVSKQYSRKGQLELAAFEAGNDALCFSENVPEGIEEILKFSTDEKIDRSFQRLMALKQKAGLFNAAILPEEEELTENDSLNLEIAEKSLTLLKNEDDFIPLEKGAAVVKISIGKSGKNTFFRTIAPDVSGPLLEIADLEEVDFSNIKEQMNAGYEVVIALFPPSVKPVNNFGLPDNLISFLTDLAASQSCILYLFGNPYVLRVLKNKNSMKGLVVAYQDFNEFQETAANHLLGKVEAIGEMPVKIDLT